jgi:predicted Zn-dependent protease
MSDGSKKESYMKIWNKGFSIVAALIVALVLEGCAKVPVTGRRQLSLVSAGEETQLGLESFSQLKTNTPISHARTANAMVQRVGSRIAQIAGKDLPNANWEFVVFDSKEANAFCLPGGKVGVYTGLLPLIKSDAELATVLGHEIAHATAHHGNERMSEAMAIQTVGKLGGSAIEGSKYHDAALIAYGVGAKGLRELPHSRAQESEADRIGLTYMARAGYDPSAAVTFWQRFSDYNKQQGGGSSLGFLTKFLSTHPVDAKRIADLQALLPGAQAEYQKSSKP